MIQYEVTRPTNTTSWHLSTNHTIKPGAVNYNCQYKMYCQYNVHYLGVTKDLCLVAHPLPMTLDLLVPFVNGSGH